MKKNFEKSNFVDIINYQMELNWYNERFDDLVKIDWWVDKFTTIKEKEDEFKNYLKNEFKKFIPVKRINTQVQWFILNYWLRVMDE